MAIDDDDDDGTVESVIQVYELSTLKASKRDTDMSHSEKWGEPASLLTLFAQ